MTVKRLVKRSKTPKGELEAEGTVIKGGYTQIEIDSFPTQLEEALAWTANKSASTVMIDAIISESGDDKADLVARILTKSLYFKAAVGKAIGRKQRKTQKAK